MLSRPYATLWAPFDGLRRWLVTEIPAGYDRDPVTAAQTTQP
ncbi:hypothetical protein [Streptosporangium sp. NPDC003464]